MLRKMYSMCIYYMVQYAIIQLFDQNLQKTENFFLATIFKVRHRMSSYIGKVSKLSRGGPSNFPAVRVEYKTASE